MNVRDVKAVARQWATEEASEAPGFFGAYFVGSINWMSDDAPFPVTSDVDIQVVYEGDQPPGEHRKFIYRDVLIEVGYAASSLFESPESILGNYPRTCHLARESIIADPTGQMRHIQGAVAEGYARRRWVEKRCEHARERLLTSFGYLKESEPFHDQVFAELYATIVPTHIVLVAGLENPTIRKGFVACREVLDRFGQMEVYEAMLAILGSDQMSRSHVEGYLAALMEVFDVAKETVRTPFFWSTNVSDLARPVVFDGSRALIESGFHREAMLWIACVHTWCQKILANDGSLAVQRKYTPAFQRLVHDLGIGSYSALSRRNEENRDTLLPAVWRAAQSIIASNPEVRE